MKVNDLSSDDLYNEIKLIQEKVFKIIYLSIHKAQFLNKI